ncbi:MAG: hypothetical protein Q8M86_06130 [Syntrophales bacterium]|nr:hypothetical protein [Syntrophales bacterium]MDP3097505.1 hypothetical protein [Syntrophales bacterium]
MATIRQLPRKYVWTLPEGLSDSAAALTEALADFRSPHRIKDLVRIS